VPYRHRPHCFSIDQQRAHEGRTGLLQLSAPTLKITNGHVGLDPLITIQLGLATGFETGIDHTGVTGDFIMLPHGRAQTSLSQDKARVKAQSLFEMGNGSFDILLGPLAAKTGAPPQVFLVGMTIFGGSGDQPLITMNLHLHDLGDGSGDRILDLENIVETALIGLAP
jgi:hypothetical protein